MKELEERIVKEGQILDNNIIKVGSFLNQQVDINFLKKMAEETMKLFNTKITKVLTIEASGIPFACMIALEYHVPLIFAKKNKTSNVSGDVVSATVYSYTGEKNNEIIIPKEYISSTDKVLVADDFLANGNSLKGLIICI